MEPASSDTQPPAVPGSGAAGGGGASSSGDTNMLPAVPGSRAAGGGGVAEAVPDAVLVREAVAEAARPETEPSTLQPFDPSTLQSSRTQVLEQAAAALEQASESEEAARLGRGTSEPAVRGGTSVDTANVDPQVSEAAAEACPERNSAISAPSHSPETVASLDDPRGASATLVVARTCPEAMTALSKEVASIENLLEWDFHPEERLELEGLSMEVPEVAAEACPERSSAISAASHSPETVASLDNPRGANATLVVARSTRRWRVGEVGAPAPEDLLVVSNLYGQRRCFNMAMWKNNAEFAKLTFERLIVELVTHFGSMQPEGYETFMKGLGLLVLPGIKTLLNILFEGKVPAFEKKLHEAIDNPEEPFQPLHSSSPQPFNPSS